ncbi:MAG TPA: F0F1 ATP synthase subunit B [Geminicoccaceae bacterium]|nr:F0F1 ATP synthase subunit B [Geminicoccaceae bacterium]
MEYFWLAVALLILVALLWRPVKKNVIGALDARAARIRSELEEAQRLHEEAKALLAGFQRQLHEGESLAAEIRELAETERVRLEAQLRAEYEATVERRTRQAMDRIAQEEARALQEVRARAADLAARTTRRLISERLDGPQAQKLLGNAIDEVQQKLA